MAHTHHDPSPPSVLRGINQVNRRLERLLLELRDQPTADTDLRALAQELMAAVRRAPEVALAAIFLNQIAGSYAVRHCTEAAIIVCMIAGAMEKSSAEVEVVTAAALTMNVGLVRQGDLFQGRDGALSSAERSLVRRHPSDGVEMLRWAGITDERWLELVLLHHENDDGSGYPEGRLGHQISQNAKLIGLADRYCAFVSARNYRRSLLPTDALQRLAADSGMPIDHALVAHFGREIGAYPPGTLVRLESGAMGVVASRRNARGEMAVHVMRGADGEPLAEVRHERTIAAAVHEDDARLRFSMKEIWGELASV